MSTHQPTAPLADLKPIDIIAQEARLVAASFGINCASDMAQSLVARIVKHLGGQKIYIPSETTQTVRLRNQKIHQKFTGDNYDDLAAQHRISPRQVRNIVKSQGM
jgi:Mor family transcriptional regulator